MINIKIKTYSYLKLENFKIPKKFKTRENINTYKIINGISMTPKLIDKKSKQRRKNFLVNVKEG